MQAISIACADGRPRAPPPSLTFRTYRGLTPALLGKTFFSTRRPALETGGQRPTARCALGRKSVWIICSLAPLLRGEGWGEGLLLAPVPPHPDRKGDVAEACFGVFKDGGRKPPTLSPQR